MAAPRIGTVLAHPDDETFGTGGTLIRAVRQGSEAHSLCLTRGEAGWAGDPDAPIATRESLGEVRAGELREAGRRIGLTSVTVLDWGDGKLAGADSRAVEDDILAWLRRVRPEVLITWGPDGGYRHPDHIAAGERCIAALARAGDALPRIVYRFVLHQTSYDMFSEHFPEWTDLLSSMVAWPDERIAVRVDLSDDEFRAKWHAMQAHRSQSPDLRNYETLIPFGAPGLKVEAYLRHSPPQDGTLKPYIF